MTSMRPDLRRGPDLRRRAAETGHSRKMPGEVDVRTRLTRTIELNIPIISSAMDTVTEARLAIAMAQAGGIGVIHRNMEPEAQAEEVRKVKRFESGMVVDPITIGPDATLAEALALMRRHNISGIPVVERGPAGLPAPLVGIVTNRDVRFADDPGQPVADLMTKKVITVREGVRPDDARRLLHQHRIEKLVVVDDEDRCVGLLTVKDMEKATLHPLRLQGRRRPAAGRGGIERRRQGVPPIGPADGGGGRLRRGRHGARPFPAWCSTRWRSSSASRTRSRSSPATWPPATAPRP